MKISQQSASLRSYLKHSSKACYIKFCSQKSRTFRIISVIRIIPLNPVSFSFNKKREYKSYNERKLNNCNVLELCQTKFLHIYIYIWCFFFNISFFDALCFSHWLLVTLLCLLLLCNSLKQCSFYFFIL